MPDRTLTLDRQILLVQVAKQYVLFFSVVSAVGIHPDKVYCGVDKDRIDSVIRFDLAERGFDETDHSLNQAMLYH